MPAVLAPIPGRLCSAFAEHPEQGGSKLFEVGGVWGGCHKRPTTRERPFESKLHFCLEETDLQRLTFRSALSRGGGTLCVEHHWAGVALYKELLGEQRFETNEFA